MYIASKLEGNLVCTNFDLIRENIKMIVTSCIEQIIIDKPAFEMSDFALYYYDDYETQTNCNRVGEHILYVEIMQPKNIKIDSKPKHKRKNAKMTMPDLHYDLEKFRKDLLDKFVNVFGENTTMWLSKFDICMNHAEQIDENKYESMRIRIRPCITYSNVNSDNLYGVMYGNDRGEELQIEYPIRSIENFNKKNEATKDNYRKCVCIIKNLLLSKTKIDTLPTEIYETLLYNVPNELFTGTSEADIVKIVNFIRNCDLSKLLSLDEMSKAFVDPYRSMSYLYTRKMIKEIEKELREIIKS